MTGENDKDYYINTTLTENESIKDIFLIIQKVQLYYMPILCTFGTIGNILSVYVFFSTKLRKLSSSYYLSALAITDTGVLISSFFTWLELVDVQGFNTSILCQLWVYLSYVSIKLHNILEINLSLK